MKKQLIDCRESTEWCYNKAENVCGGVTKYRLYNISWTIPDFSARLNTLRPGVKCWETVTLAGQKVCLGVERRVESRNSRPRNNLPVEYMDWVDLSLRNVSPCVVWIHRVQVSVAGVVQSIGSVDLHQNERIQGLTRFVTVDRLRSSVLSKGNTELSLVWQIMVESGGARPAQGTLTEERQELANHFWGLYQQSLLTDYTLVCKGKEVAVHRAVLAARSEYWRALFTSGMVEAVGSSAEVRTLSWETLHLLLEFIYTGRIQERVEPREMEHLLEAADFYGVSSLKEQCEEGLILSLEPANLVDRLVLGDTYSAAQLRRVAKEMLVQNVDMLTEIPDWKTKLEARVTLALEVMEGLAVARAKQVGGQKKLERTNQDRQDPEPEDLEPDSEEGEGEYHEGGDHEMEDIMGHGQPHNVIFNDGVPVAHMV